MAIKQEFELKKNEVQEQDKPLFEKNGKLRALAIFYTRIAHGKTSPLEIQKKTIDFHEYLSRAAFMFVRVPQTEDNGISLTIVANIALKDAQRFGKIYKQETIFYCDLVSISGYINANHGYKAFGTNMLTPTLKWVDDYLNNFIEIDFVSAYQSLYDSLPDNINSQFLGRSIVANSPKLRLQYRHLICNREDYTYDFTYEGFRKRIPEINKDELVFDKTNKLNHLKSFTLFEKDDNIESALTHLRVYYDTFDGFVLTFEAKLSSVKLFAKENGIKRFIFEDISGLYVYDYIKECDKYEASYTHLYPVTYGDVDQLSTTLYNISISSHLAYWKLLCNSTELWLSFNVDLPKEEQDSLREQAYGDKAKKFYERRFLNFYSPSYFFKTLNSFSDEEFKEYLFGEEDRLIYLFNLSSEYFHEKLGKHGNDYLLRLDTYSSTLERALSLDEEKTSQYIKKYYYKSDDIFDYLSSYSYTNTIGDPKISAYVTNDLLLYYVLNNPDKYPRLYKTIQKFNNELLAKLDVTDKPRYNNLRASRLNGVLIQPYHDHNHRIQEYFKDEIYLEIYNRNYINENKEKDTIIIRLAPLELNGQSLTTVDGGNFLVEICSLTRISTDDEIFTHFLYEAITELVSYILKGKLSVSTQKTNELNDQVIYLIDDEDNPVLSDVLGHLGFESATLPYVATKNHIVGKDKARTKLHWLYLNDSRID